MGSHYQPFLSICVPHTFARAKAEKDPRHLDAFRAAEQELELVDGIQGKAAGWRDPASAEVQSPPA